MTRTLPTVFLVLSLLVLGCSGGFDVVPQRPDSGPPVPPTPTCLCGGDPDQTGCPSDCCFDGWCCVVGPTQDVCTKSGYDVPGGSLVDWKCTDEGEFTQCESTSSDAPGVGPGWQCQRNAQGKLVCISNNPDDPGRGGPWGCVYDDVGTATCTNPPPDTPPPDDDGKWSCNYDGTKEICRKKPADKPNDQPGWTCVPIAGGDRCHSDVPGQSAEGSGWICTPENGGTTCVSSTPDQPDHGGPWGCVYDDVGGITCTADSGDDWICVPDGAGHTTCTDTTPNVPDDGTWDCFDVDGKTVCYGSGDSPGSGGWICQTDDVGRARCENPPDYPPDQPGSGTWICWYDDVGYRVCSDAPPLPPGNECVYGQRKWCDGATYCGWGILECRPDGTWPTDPNDCIEQGKRPNTVCACGFAFFNPDCCERPDCLVPPGTNGQVCPASPGKQCDYCNGPPNNLTCAAGFTCVFFHDLSRSTYETYCGKDCSASRTCPSGFECIEFPGAPGHFACMPPDRSCYY
jgi:hypothetical protein